LLIFLGVVTAIVSNIGFLGMHIERMNREALESAKVQARQEEATRLSEQIAQLDRRRSVGEIAASLAHELSQPLTNIYLIADRMELSLQQRQDDSLNKYFEDLNRKKYRPAKRRRHAWRACTLADSRASRFIRSMCMPKKPMLPTMAVTTPRKISKDDRGSWVMAVGSLTPSKTPGMRMTKTAAKAR
jgi:signal transduction histidine kinase